MYMIAKSASGPIADMFADVNAGTILEKIRAGRARSMTIAEAPLAAA